VTSTEKHSERIKEHLIEIRDAIDERIEKKPIPIGFHCSACAVELLELYLHKINKIPPCKIIKHNWFKRPKSGQKKDALAERKIGAEFQNKEQIYELIYLIEEHRDNLVYGHTDPRLISIVLGAFLKFRSIIQEKLLGEGITIEKE